MKNYIFILLLVVALPACQNQQIKSQQHAYTNKLIDETSPYLLQHAHNPVNWYPWGDEALQKAKAENKLVIVSVGYAACHWCHVMEHESFEDTTIARIMNENYVAIKVDREERPDVDQIYMDAAYLINKRGGWPLNAITLPDGRPVFAGTYFPPDNWKQVVEYFTNEYQKDPLSFQKQAEQVTAGIKDLEKVPRIKHQVSFSTSDLDRIFKGWRNKLDLVNGGRKSDSNKFPMPSNWTYLLQYQHLTKNKNVLEAVTTTLDKMAMGGIYDHLGGGFARYSTDPYWKVPHFEKMLYDNAQLVSLYSQAYQLTKKPLYKKRVYETLEFVQRELTDSNGGFYSSLDADSEGEEGTYYVWTKHEIEDILQEDAAWFMQFFNITTSGNWEEEKNVLHQTLEDSIFAQQQNQKTADFANKLAQAKQKLFKVRNERERPGLDDKILTAWNGLMLKGYIDAYRVFGEESFLAIARKNADFLRKNCLQEDDRLTRNYKANKATINAFLDDYALVIEAFIALYQATFEEQWLQQAKQLADYTHQHFFDDSTGMFFYTSDLDDPLIARKMEITDNVIPASNSSLAKGFYALGTYLYDTTYLKIAEQMLKNVKDNIVLQAPFYSNWASLLYQFAIDPYEIAIVGKDFDQKRRELDQHYLPNTFLLGGENEGTLPLLKNKLVDKKTMIYVCQQKVCKLPVTETGEAIKLMK